VYTCFSCWSKCLDTVGRKHAKKASKWWFHLYQLTQSYVSSDQVFDLEFYNIYQNFFFQLRFIGDLYIISFNRISGVMVSMLASSAVDRGFQSRLGQTKDYKIGICCFSAKHAALKRKSKNWLARNNINVSEWSDMSTHRLLFQWASTIKIHLSVLV
jgi:hypothetical protein